MSKPKSETRISPKGTFVYPRLNRPDTKFDEAGVYSVKLRLSTAEAKPLTDMIDKAIDQSVEKTKASGEVKGKVKRADAPYVVDEESDSVIISFKMKASGTRSDGTVFTQKPGLKTAGLKDIPEDRIIGGGSEGRVAFTVAPFHTKLVGAGVSLRLKAVQMFTIVAPSYSYGFEAEEDIDEACEFAKDGDEDNGNEGSDADGGEGGSDATDF